jgi:hypothetical protein
MAALPFSTNGLFNIDTGLPNLINADLEIDSLKTRADRSLGRDI